MTIASCKISLMPNYDDVPRKREMWEVSERQLVDITRWTEHAHLVLQWNETSSREVKGTAKRSFRTQEDHFWTTTKKSAVGNGKSLVQNKLCFEICLQSQHLLPKTREQKNKDWNATFHHKVSSGRGHRKSSLKPRKTNTFFTQNPLPPLKKKKKIENLHFRFNSQTRVHPNDHTKPWVWFFCDPPPPPSPNELFFASLGFCERLGWPLRKHSEAL